MRIISNKRKVNQQSVANIFPHLSLSLIIAFPALALWTGTAPLCLTGKGKDGCAGIRLGKDKLAGFALSRIRENILTEENLVQLVHLVNEELLETATRHEKELHQTERQLTQVNNKLARLYVALESGKLDLDDLAPRVKELRVHQHELQQRRDHLPGKMESKGP